MEAGCKASRAGAVYVAAVEPAREGGACGGPRTTRTIKRPAATQLEELQARFEELTNRQTSCMFSWTTRRGPRPSAEEGITPSSSAKLTSSEVSKTFLEEKTRRNARKGRFTDDSPRRGGRPRQRQSTEADDLRRDIEDLEVKLADQDAELEVLRGKLAVADMSFLAPEDPGQAPRDAGSAPSAADQTSFVAALEDRLDDAYTRDWPPEARARLDPTTPVHAGGARRQDQGPRSGEGELEGQAQQPSSSPSSDRNRSSAAVTARSPSGSFAVR